MARTIYTDNVGKVINESTDKVELLKQRKAQAVITALHTFNLNAIPNLIEDELMPQLTELGLAEVASTDSTFGKIIQFAPNGETVTPIWDGIKTVEHVQERWDDAIAMYRHFATLKFGNADVVNSMIDTFEAMGPENGALVVQNAIASVGGFLRSNSDKQYTLFVIEFKNGDWQMRVTQNESNPNELVQFLTQYQKDGGEV